MRTGLQRHDLSPNPGSPPTGIRPSRCPAPRTLAGLFAVVLLGAQGASAIEPAAPVLEPGPIGSNDLVILTGDHSMVMNAALETAVTGNTVNFEGPGTAGATDARGSQNLHLSGSDNYSRLFGVTAVAQNSGSSVSQNVNVNAVILVEIGGAASGGAMDLLGAFDSGSPPTAP